jgi:hypothetical protein
MRHMLVKRNLSRVTSIEDRRSLAEQRVHRAFIHYADQGSDGSHRDPVSARDRSTKPDEPLQR